MQPIVVKNFIPNLESASATFKRSRGPSMALLGSALFFK